MTLHDVYLQLSQLYGWAAERSLLVFACACALPLLGTLAAWVGKGGKTDRDGRWIANLLLISSLLLVGFELVALVVAHATLDRGPQWIMEVDALLLVAPLAYLGLTLVGIRQVFPLGQLETIRRLTSLGLLAGGVLFLVWLAGRFFWGVVFVAHFAWLLVLFGVAALVLWHLWRRTVGPAPAGR